MDFDLARHNMVAEQLEQRGIDDPACWRRWSGCRDMSSYRTGFLRRRITIGAADRVGADNFAAVHRGFYVPGSAVKGDG